MHRHHLAESVLVAGDEFRYGDARVVARLDDDSAQQVFELHRPAFLDEHARAAGPPRLDADRHVVVERNPFRGEFHGGHVARHDLREARRGQRRGAVALGKHAARSRRHQDIALGRDGRWIGDDVGGALRHHGDDQATQTHEARPLPGEEVQSHSLCSSLIPTGLRPVLGSWHRPCLRAPPARGIPAARADVRHPNASATGRCAPRKPPPPV